MTRAPAIVGAASFASLVASGCGVSGPAPVGQATSSASGPRSAELLDGGADASADAGSGGHEPVVSATPIAAPAIEGASIEAAVWSPGGRWLGGFCALGCSAPQGSTAVSAPLHVLDRRTGALHASLPMSARPQAAGGSAVFSPDDAFVAMSHQGDSFRLSRVDDGKVLRDVAIQAVHDGFAFSPDGSRLLIASVFGASTLLGLPKGNVVRADTVSTPTSAPVDIAWSPSGAHFLFTRTATELRDGRTGKRLAEIPGARSADDSLVVFRDATSAIFATCDGLVRRVYTSPFSTEDLRGAGEPSWCGISASPGGTQIYRGTEAGVDVFDVASRASRMLPSPGASGRAAVLSPDGKWLAEVRQPVGQGDAQVHVLDVSGAAAPVVLGGVDVVGWAANGELYRADGNELVAWSPATRKDVWCGAFEVPTRAHTLSPDGRFVASADGQLVLVRTSDHRVLRVSIALDPKGVRLVPEAAEIAGFLR